MSSFEKPVVDVPFEGSPPIELVLDDLIIGEGAECEPGQIISCLLYTSPRPRDDT